MIFTERRKCDGILTYYVRFELPDSRRKKELAGTSWEQARKLLRKRLGEVDSNTYVDPKTADRSRFSQFEERFLKDYASRYRSDHYRSILKRVRQRIGDRPLQEVTRGDLDGYAAARLRGDPLPGVEKGRAVSPSTVRKELMALGTFFKMAVRWGVLSVNPAVDLQKPSEPQHKTRYLSSAEWETLDSVAPSWLRPLLRMAIATGMRLGEVVTLRWDGLDKKAELLHVAENTKTGTRAIPVNATVREVLDSQVRHVRSIQVFVDSAGEPYTSREARLRITRTTIAAMKKAKVKDASFHTLRHTAASFMAQAGVELLEVQRILGHSTPVMTQRYSHLKPEHLRKGVEAIDAALRSKVHPTVPASRVPQTVPRTISANASLDVGVVNPARVVGFAPRARSSGDRATAF